MMSFVISCASNPIKFNPDIHIGNHHLRSIVSERGDNIRSHSPDFSKYGCMHVDKWKELKALLIRNGSTSPVILGRGFGGR